MPAQPARVAVVSGTSSGIGAATAVELLKRGYQVIGLSRRGNTALTTDRGYTDSRADLRDPGSVEAALDRAAPITGGGVDVVVANAGVSPGPRPLSELPWSLAADAYEDNVRTALSLVQCTAPLLRRAGGGSYTFVGASLANGQAPERFAYAAAKAALTTLMRACSVEFAADRIIANEVRPGPVATAMTMAGLNEAAGDQVLAALNAGFGIDWLKPARTVAAWIATIAEFPANGPTGQVFNYSRKTL
ncbi:SDR family NAD(P)-dependent oxidoreductase [Actinoplanes sp. NPDC049265]|uniref:SDR family NAD(P)-dependent oxidoreductase n=1 Tax=Actinoplanes sp. NPDC049265 TaxID=3363902 RepID=UPI0037115322